MLTSPNYAADQAVVGTSPATVLGFRRATETPTSASAPPDVGHRRRHLVEEQPAHDDGDRRDEVGRHAEVARGHGAQRVGERGERDRGREDAEVDDPPDVGGRRVAGVVEQLPRERQADDRADGAREPGDVDGGQPRDERLLEDQADGVDDCGDQAEHHAGDAAAAAGVGRRRDQGDAAERQREADGEVRREALGQEHRRQQRDQHGGDLDEHHGGAGVDVLLAGVEGDVVDAEPEHADGHDRDPLTAGRPGHAATEGDDAEAQRADQEPPQGQRAGLEGAREVPDRHERARPEHQRHPDRRERQPGRRCGRLGGRRAGLGSGGHVSTLGTATDTGHAVFGRRSVICRQRVASPRFVCAVERRNPLWTADESR